VGDLLPDGAGEVTSGLLLVGGAFVRGFLQIEAEKNGMLSRILHSWFDLRTFGVTDAS
jgi:hypothetical protein